MTIDLQAVTSEDVIRAILTLDGMKVPASELRPGDRIIYRRRGVIHETIVADAHALNGGFGWWSITTTNGDSWECSPKNQGQYRLPADIDAEYAIRAAVDRAAADRWRADQHWHANRT